MKSLFAGFGVAVLLVVVLAAVLLFGVASDVASTAYNEVGPKALLTKYMWFKDAAATLDAQRANINTKDDSSILFRGLLPKDRTKWDRMDKQTIAQNLAELEGLKMAFNNLAAEYNSAMAKVNWRFCNVGELPQGAIDVLPREFKRYLNN